MKTGARPARPVEHAGHPIQTREDRRARSHTRRPYPCPVRIHVTYTGGTIGMVDSPRGLVPGADPENRLDAALK